MKSAFLSLLIAFATVAAPAADIPSIVGNWQVHITVGSYDNTVTCTFVQNAQTLSGKCDTDGGPADITGKVSATAITWSYKTNYQGTPITAVYDGTVGSGQKISGTINVPELTPDGTFTATQSK
jgi:hypothetical protein